MIAERRCGLFKARPQTVDAPKSEVDEGGFYTTKFYKILIINILSKHDSFAKCMLHA